MTIVGGKVVDPYPLAMWHPNARVATSHPVERTDPISGRTTVVKIGEADTLPPQTVRTYEQEIRLRQLGYLARGEAPGAFVYHDYPKWLHHPDHVPEVPAVPPIIDAHNKLVVRPDGQPVFAGEPAIPAVLPPVLVQNAEEAAKWEAKGYRDLASDPIAAQSLAAHVDRDYVPLPDGWDDDMIERTSSGHPKYPMWADGPNGTRVLVNSRKEHEVLLGPKVEPDPQEAARARREAAQAALAKAQAELDAADAVLSSTPVVIEAPRRRGRPAAA